MSLRFEALRISSRCPYGSFDEMSERSAADYAGGNPEPRARRALLRKAMEDEGFTVYPDEWWHFDYKDWKLYRVLDIPFSEIRQR